MGEAQRIMCIPILFLVFLKPFRSPIRREALCGNPSPAPQKGIGPVYAELRHDQTVGNGPHGLQGQIDEVNLIQDIDNADNHGKSSSKRPWYSWTLKISSAVHWA